MDINIPIAENKNPQKDGGIRLLENLRRAKKLNQPNKLIGLTGYSECYSKYENEFKKDGYYLIHYSSSATDWQKPLGNIINQIDSLSSKSQRISINRESLDLILSVLIIVITIVAIFLPISYTPTQRTMLFFVNSILLAILFGKNAQTKFNLKLPGFVFSTVGAAAIAMGCMVLLHHLNSPDISIGVYEIFDEQGKRIELENSDIKVPVGINASTPEIFVRGNSLIVIFPHGCEKVSVEIKKYFGDIRYIINKKECLHFGKDLFSVN